MLRAMDIQGSAHCTVCIRRLDSDFANQKRPHHWSFCFTGHLQSSGPGASNGQRLDVDMGKNMEFIFWKAGMLKDDWLRLPALAYHMDRRGIPTVFLQYSCILKPELIRMIR